MTIQLLLPMGRHGAPPSPCCHMRPWVHMFPHVLRFYPSRTWSISNWSAAVLTHEKGNAMNFKVGDRVCFKSGIEQYGKITRIMGSRADVKVWDSDRGEYETHSVALNRLSHD